MLGLSLSGGGARGAYQAGVIQGLAEILGPLAEDNNPFDCYAGTSAGAINTTFCAAGPVNLIETAARLTELWSDLHPHQVYRTDIVSHSRIGLGWMRDLSFGSLFKNKMAKELLDASPLLKLLDDGIDFSNIGRKIDAGHLRAVTCSAFRYDEQKVVSFFQAADSVQEWTRSKRYGRRTPLTARHVLASCSIPVLFSPVKVDGFYYGDGTLRNTAPISPILHMGSQNIIFVGVRYGGPVTVDTFTESPPIAKVFGTVLNGLFFDNLDVDIERLRHVNQIVESNGLTIPGAKKINYLHIQPSQDLGRFAEDLASKFLPRILEFLLGGLGSDHDSAELASYLLFDSVYTRKLVALGYEDAFQRKQDLLQFWEQAHKSGL